ncbi:helix-turn-helix domain-containing protein [Sciscionella sediminilitoris]|uniref:helix-turn-helix domain-containing protein n=1 Tax=Sciscionella sediminilitoris TaxID=1445613 RepID=UPI00068F3C54|nr:helix-turn-helix transcriptional regulator [Sciscionella sp. SE31]
MATHIVESETGWWEMATGAPAAELRGLVGRYVGYREHSGVRMLQREVPTGFVGLILSFGPSIRVLDSGTSTELTSFVAAVSDRWACTQYPGDQHGVQIDVTPVAAGMILGTRMGEFGTQVVDLVEALGPPGRRLIEQLAERTRWAERFALLDRFFIDRLGTAHQPSPAAAWAVRRIRATRGRAGVAELAAALHCSTRYLSEQVRTHVGVGPKQFARIVRARHAITLLDSGRLRLTEIAERCGYTDQAHFGRDFLRITGCSPGTWCTEPFAESWTGSDLFYE